VWEVDFFPIEEVLHEETKFSDSQILDAVKRIEASIDVPLEYNQPDNPLQNA
jgi:hypothetical protein